MWKKQDIAFDGIYTGYLASKQQCAQIAGFIERFSEKETLTVVDPAMADNGKLYPAFDSDFPTAMAEVCRRADVILPNITEAAFLTGMPYRTTYEKAYIREMLERLLELGCSTAVITGVSFEPGRLGVVYLDRDGKEFSYFTKRCEQSYHGTGDIFASTVTGALMRGLDLGESLALAADYVVACIEVTAESREPRWYGAEFETVIPKLCRMLCDRLENKEVSDE